MDRARCILHESRMDSAAAHAIPTFDLYGERACLPDILHCETIAKRSVLHEWNIRPHRHERLHQFILASAGAADLMLDGGTIPLSLPSVVNLPPRTVHGFAFAPRTQGFVLTVPAELVEPTVAVLPVLAAPRTGPADAGLATLFAEAAREHAGRSPARGPNLAAFAALIAGRTAAQLADGPASARRGSALVRRFEALLEAHFRDQWRVSHYAAALGVSAQHLSRACRSATGLPASRLITARAMREGRRLLAYTPRSVVSIAEDLGFVDPAYFTRVFTRQTGLTPTAFRARAAAPPRRRSR
jgi:AraC family transcriptional activator of pobA